MFSLITSVKCVVTTVGGSTTVRPLNSASVAAFFEPLLAAHDPAVVETICYAHVKREDAVTERLRGLAQGWVSVLGLSDEAAAAGIRADGVDILVDLAGHTAENRMLVLARKPAPVQVTWLGYPGTTGLSAVDYRLTDAVADPDLVADDQAVERLVRLPHGFLCYARLPTAPAITPPPSLSRGGGDLRLVQHLVQADAAGGGGVGGDRRAGAGLAAPAQGQAAQRS
jgi:predicted O-linked N-acetylglucosamine transferase (SPINDLY family)